MSSVHVQVAEHVDVLAQASVAVQVIVRERPQVLVLMMLPAEQVTVGVPPQLSVAVGAVTLAQVGTVGLHPRSLPAGQLTRTGGVVSAVHVQVAEQVDVLAHASVAVQVMVRERPQVLVLMMLPAEQVTVGVPPQLSVAVGGGTLAQVGTVGLHPRSLPAGQLTRTGGVVSAVHVYVVEHVDVLAHASVAVQVMVRERPQVKI